MITAIRLAVHTLHITNELTSQRSPHCNTRAKQTAQQIPEQIPQIQLGEQSFQLTIKLLITNAY